MQIAVYYTSVRTEHCIEYLDCLRFFIGWDYVKVFCERKCYDLLID